MAGSGRERIAYDSLEHVVNRVGITVEDELRYIDYAFPFARKCNSRCEGEDEEQPDYGKHGGW